MMRTTSRLNGFTIVELLIVIVVIAVLAAISVVAYTGIQNRANNTIVEADIASIVKKMEEAKILLGRYPQNTTEFVSGFKFTKSAYNQTGNNLYYCLDKANDLYALSLRSKTMRGYRINTGGVVTADVTLTAAANCTSIGKDVTDVSDTDLYVVQGFTGTTSTWNSGWSWTN